MKKNDIWLMGTIVLVALVCAVFFSFSKERGARLAILVDGVEYGVYELSEEQEIQINDTNVCKIEDGKVRMISANCPDRRCVHQKAIDERGGTIVCLPNKVVLEITDAKKGDVQPDSVAS